MQNDDRAMRPTPLSGDDGMAVPDALRSTYENEIASLRSTVREMTSTIEANAQEKRALASSAVLVQQLRDANENLMLATFKARDLQAAAEVASLRQVEFLSMLAHELRNPLQPMAMAGKLLAGHVALHPTIARVAQVYARQIAHMERLVNDLLDASRINSGKISLQLAPVLLRDVLDDAVETSLEGIEQRHQRLQVQLPAMPLTIQCDRIRLAQVFSNLLTNASKFTHEYGHIDVVARQVGDTVEVTVSDDGTGIAPALQPHIFDLFTQGYRSLERAQGGLGIGLSLVRSITELHQGRARVVSEGIGKGSQFIITLPMLTPSAPVPESTAPASVLPVIPCQILLIEDNVDANDLLTILLQQDGHTVTSCFDGPSGLRAGLTQSYDVVLCDIGLPGMDGFQVIGALRAALEAPYPYFIATTGYDALAELDRATEAGFDQYFIKPVDVDALSRIIDARMAQSNTVAQRRGDSTTAPTLKNF
jgi:signal transduction histidine kinase/ActR/RegA family two-component response regulator